MDTTTRNLGAALMPRLEELIEKDDGVEAALGLGAGVLGGLVGEEVGDDFFGIRDDGLNVGSFVVEATEGLVVPANVTLAREGAVVFVATVPPFEGTGEIVGKGAALPMNACIDGV